MIAFPIAGCLSNAPIDNEIFGALSVFKIIFKHAKNRFLPPTLAPKLMSPLGSHCPENLDCIDFQHFDFLGALFRIAVENKNGVEKSLRAPRQLIGGREFFRAMASTV